jgi:hypothetical protein
MAIELPGAREKLQKYVQRMGSRPREDFLAEVKVPILVQLTEPEGAEKRAEAGVPRFGTMSMNKENLVFAEAGLYVFPLRKQATNAFGMMVTVGRAANNDIVLPYDGISKFHAYFSNLGGAWVLVDAKSTNGTFIEGRRINPDVKEKLDDTRPATEVSFSSSINCRFYSPAAFYDLMAQLMGCMKKKDG